MLCTPLHGCYFLSPGVDAIHGIIYSALSPWETDRSKTAVQLCLSALMSLLPCLRSLLSTPSQDCLLPRLGGSLNDVWSKCIFILSKPNAICTEPKQVLVFRYSDQQNAPKILPVLPPRSHGV